MWCTDDKTDIQPDIPRFWNLCWSIQQERKQILVLLENPDRAVGAYQISAL